MQVTLTVNIHFANYFNFCYYDIEVIFLNERLKVLRKYLKLNQSDFGAKLGVSHAAISALERGESNLSERMAIIISSVFDVNLEWLLYGNGSMLLNKENFFIDELTREFNLDSMDKEIVLTYLKLSSSEREGVKKMLKSLMKEQKKE